MIFPLLALVGLGLLLTRNKGATAPRRMAAPKPPLMSAQQRIVQEAQEIADGQRADFSSPPEAPEAATPPALAPEAERVVREIEEIAQGQRSEISDPVPAPDTPASDASDDEQALAIAAAHQAAAQEGGAAPAPAKPGSGMRRPGASPKPPKGRAAMPAPTSDKPVNLALAKSTAASVAAHLKQKKMNYDRRMLSLWQSRAGVPADGIYGRGSAAALKYFTPGAPPALFAQGASSYTPPR